MARPLRAGKIGDAADMLRMHILMTNDSLSVLPPKLTSDDGEAARAGSGGSVRGKPSSVATHRQSRTAVR